MNNQEIAKMIARELEIHSGEKWTARPQSEERPEHQQYLTRVKDSLKLLLRFPKHTEGLCALQALSLSHDSQMVDCGTVPRILFSHTKGGPRIAKDIYNRLVGNAVLYSVTARAKIAKLQAGGELQEKQAKFIATAGNTTYRKTHGLLYVYVGDAEFVVHPSHGSTYLKFHSTDSELLSAISRLIAEHKR